MTPKTTKAATILERTICLMLECHYLGNHRKLSVERLVEAAGGALTEIDDAQLRATLRLVDAKELSPAMRVFGHAKRYLRSRAIAAHRVFGERSYLVPLTLVEEVDEKLGAFAATLRAEASALAVRYVDAIAKQAIALGSLFDAQEYKTPQEVVGSFRLEWSYVSFEHPRNIIKVNRAMAERVKQWHQQRLTSAYDELVIQLRLGAVEVLRGLEERLTPGPDGKPKTIRGTALRDLQDYVAHLSQRNVGGDDELTALMVKVAARADGIQIEQLRDSASVRNCLRQVAADARVAAEGLVEEAGRRAINLSGVDTA